MKGEWLGVGKARLPWHLGNLTLAGMGFWLLVCFHQLFQGFPWNPQTWQYVSTVVTYTGLSSQIFISSFLPGCLTPLAGPRDRLLHPAKSPTLPVP